MNLNYKEWLPADFAGDSRVWIYQGNRSFNAAEAREIEEALQIFKSARVLK